VTITVCLIAAFIVTNYPIKYDNMPRTSVQWTGSGQ